MSYTSDPNKEDSDADGLPDLLERMLGSNPMAADTDGDSLSDAAEYSHTDDYAFVADKVWTTFLSRCAAAHSCTAPVAPSPTWSHPDPKLGLSRWTDMRDDDSDDDGLSDGVEVAGWSITVTSVPQGSPNSVTATNTVSSDPLDANSDGDTLDDAAEKAAGTHPFHEDTDGDGDDDGTETSICTSTSCRHPAVWDRKVTVKYTQVSIAGDCDLAAKEDIYARLYFRRPGDTWVLMEQIDQSQYAPYVWTLGNWHSSFIADHGKVFELSGAVVEYDGSAADAALMYQPSGCSDCGMLTSTYHSGVDTNTDTRHRVDDNLITGGVKFQELGEACPTSTFTATVDVSIVVN